ncbi:MAG: transporter substrate-binding domain-containing protein [Bacteroidales bacterium]|jgi:membrane-bound lytic murein transglycosylase F|nr:transporter substrate-binding domain-containing protein [Bacteroidales bacterium]
MKEGKKIIIFFTIWVLLLLSTWGLNRLIRVKQLNLYSDFQTIQQREYILAGILQNTTDYYVDNGTVKGFHYELVELFANRFNLKTQYIVYNTYWDGFFALATGKVDVLAMDLNSNFRNNMVFLFTSPHSYSSHVLVQHKDNMLIDKNFNIFPNKHTKDKLENTTVHLSVDGLSDFYEDALYLFHQFDVHHTRLSLKEMPNIEDMLDLLNEKQIDMTIANEKVMKSNAGFYRKLDYSVQLTDELSLHWAVNKDNISLQTPLNHWLDSLKKERYYAILLNKYYSSTSKNRQSHSMLTNKTISLYDDLIKECAKIYHIDWRLMAAIIYQESKFNPHVTGKGGSFGLTQLMPETAAHLGMKPPYSVEKQILYGCKYLYNLKKKYDRKGVNPFDLYKFVLAAYNAGSCHIDDAQLLAKEKGYNPNQWKDVEKMLLKLADKKYTQNTQLKCGNYNGKSAKNYVANVWNTYQHYQNMSD